MEQSANLQLPYIMPSQAQKHVTHNEAIRTLDALVQPAILDRDLATPPASPADGDRYLVAVGGTDAWAGKDGNVAAWQDGAWAFLAPNAGWLLWVVDETRLIGFDGTAWIDAAVHSVNPAPLVGVNVTADATNRLAVKSPASLFDEEAGDHRLKINKAAPGDTASLVFQSGYSGRAEFGLAGDDDWHVKVSADGAVWTEALTVDRATGRVRLPAALPLADENQVVTRRHVRELLTANRTYYVRTDGSNANDGLADTAGGAFLTVQRAIDVARALDLSIDTVTIQIGSGTFAENISIGDFVGGAGTHLVLRGNGRTNTTIGAGSGTAVSFSGPVRAQFGNLTFAANQSIALHADTGARVTVNQGDIGVQACSSRYFNAQEGATILIGSNVHMSGNAQYAIYAQLMGRVMIGTSTWQTTTALAFSQAFAFARQMAMIARTGSVTFNLAAGAVTGKRYDAVTLSLIDSVGQGASFFPGDSSGATATGGQYA